MLTPLEKAHAKRREMAEKGIKVERLSPVEKAKKNPTSLRMAINAHCWMCAGNGDDGAKFTRETIRDCQVSLCPLLTHRPYRVK